MRVYYMGKRVRDININYAWYERVKWGMVASLFIGALVGCALFINTTTGL